MTLTDAQFQEWNESANKEPIVRAVITGFDEADQPIIIRASSGEYKNANYVFRSRIVEYELRYYFRLGVGEESIIDASLLRLENPDGRVDTWVRYRLEDVTIDYGDARWENESDFRAIFIGTISNMSYKFRYIEFKMAAQQNKMNLTIDFSQYPSSVGGSKLPGVVLYDLMTYNNVFAPSEIDTDSLDALDLAFPYIVDVDVPPDGELMISVADRCFSQYLFDLWANRNGIMQAIIFNEPVGSSVYPPFTPEREPIIRYINPIGEVISAGYGQGTERFENATTKSRYPNVWREVPIGVEVLEPPAGNRTACANDIMDIFDRVWEEVTIETKRNISMLNLGDEIAFKFERYGYTQIKYGIVTLIRERLNKSNILGAYFEQ